MELQIDDSITFCLIRALNKPAEVALQLQHNRDYLATWRRSLSARQTPPTRRNTRGQTPPVTHPVKPTIALTTDSSKIYDPSLGHVFGSDNKKADILLAKDNTTGVSGAQFRIYLDVTQRLPTHLLLQNMSNNGTWANAELIHGLVEVSSDGTVVESGPVTLHITFLRLGQPFLEKWLQFRREIMNAVPVLAGLQLQKRFDPTPDLPPPRPVRPCKKGLLLQCASGATFECYEELGKGAYGSVLRASRDHDGAAFAVKRARKITNRPVPELGIAFKLSHPHLVQYTDYRNEPSYVYIVMEYCEFGDLQRLLKTQGCLNEAGANNLCKPMVEALCYLHKENIVHRDMKPANILVFRDEPTHYKLSDFGLSRIIQPGDSMLSFCGTAQYVAPETCDTRYDFGIDIWSLGVILWEVLTGTSPMEWNENIHGWDMSKLALTLRRKYRVWETDKGTEWRPDESALEKARITEEGRTLILDMLEVEPAYRPSAEECWEYRWLYTGA